MTEYHAWLYLQDGTSTGININSIGSNLLNNSIEKIITYKSFLKLIPTPGQDINAKSKLKMLSEWTISGDYYQMYGWTSGQSSKINAHNLEFDDYPGEDFFGDLILFKIDPTNHQILYISENDVHTIDIANREDEIDEDDEEEENKENDSDSDNEKGNEDGEEEADDDADEEGDDDDDDDENADYDYDDDKVENDEGGDEDNLYEDDDDEDGESSGRTRKKQISKNNLCNFSRLISSNILKEHLEKTTPDQDTPKQKMIIDNFSKLLFPKKDKLNKQETNVIRELERGVYNWTIREADKKGFMCYWEDRNFIKIYIRKAISIYQNLCSDNSKLVAFALEGDNAYKLSEMTPTELNPEKHESIINKIKEKNKVMFEKQKAVGSKHFKCGKCKERDVAVTTAQTRSGDEGITLFLTCNNCGNQWKMS
jgi:DNA-directed RNA polymerase subunit M/transcription elongation factor TFIIS